MNAANEWLARAVPSAKDRTTLLRGSAAMLVMLTLSRGVPAWKEWEEAQLLPTSEAVSELSAARSLLRSRGRAAGEARHIAATLDSLRGATIEASSANAAGAALATLATDLAEENGARIGSTAIKNDSVGRDGYARVSVRLTAVADVEALTDFIAAVELARPLMGVRELTVSQGEPAAAADHADALRFEIAIDALALVKKAERAVRKAVAQSSSPVPSAATP